MIAAWLLVVATALGADVLGWRGDGSGVFPGADPPVRWSSTTNVVWRARLPAWGNASPVVVGDRVIVTAEPTTLLAVRAADGVVLWRHEHGVDLTLPPEARAAARREMAEIPTLRAAVLVDQRAVSDLRRQARAGGGTPELLARLDVATKALYAKQARLADLEARYPTPPAEQGNQYASGFVGFASSTPVSDGRRIYAVFGNGVVAARELDGTLAWAVNVGRPADEMKGYHEGHAASPVLAGGVLVVGLGRLVGLDPRTGAVRWKGDVYRDFGTPAVVDVGGVTAVVTPSGAVVRASDGVRVASLDREVWYLGPVRQGSSLWVVGNQTGESASASQVALALSGSSVTRTTRWTAPLPVDRYYGAPAPLGGFLHLISRKGKVLALSATTGAVAFREALTLTGAEEVYPSPSAAADRVYLTSDRGQTLVLKVTPTGYQRLALNTLEELRSSLVFVGRDLYARGLTSLWRIREGG